LYLGLRSVLLLTIFAVAGGLASAGAQALSTGSRAITPSVFAGGSGVYTGLDSGRNLSVMAGLDIAFLPDRRFHPALEYRAMYAVDKGGVDSLKNNLGGVKVATNWSARGVRVQPYVDLLAGRGETTYANGGYQVPGKPIFYTLSSSNVFSAGGGGDVFFSKRLAVKLDVQIERYSSPVTVSGHLYSEVGTVGLVYVFHLFHTVM
jgi:hypothetical protein